MVATIKLIYHYCSESPSQGIWTKKRKGRYKFSSVCTGKEKEVGKVVHMCDVYLYSWKTQIYSIEIITEKNLVDFQYMKMMIKYIIKESKLWPITIEILGENLKYTSIFIFFK